MSKRYKFLLLIILMSIFLTILSIFTFYKYQINVFNKKISTNIVDNNEAQGKNIEINSIPSQAKDTNSINTRIINDNNMVITKSNIIGSLSIPDISLENAPIKEGTNSTVLSNSIGHFNSTNIYNGNVGLASHNAGGRGDYFKNLKNINIGSEIFYQTFYGTKKYIVETKTIIEETDFSYLESTQDNRITLITCVSGKKNQRLCVQAVEG